MGGYLLAIANDFVLGAARFPLPRGGIGMLGMPGTGGMGDPMDICHLTSVEQVSAESAFADWCILKGCQKRTACVFLCLCVCVCVCLSLCLFFVGGGACPLF